jgi:hypothetical protein
MTMRLRKNPKNPMRNKTKADTTYPHLGMRRGNPSSYARTTVSLKLSGYEVIVHTLHVTRIKISLSLILNGTCHYTHTW